MEIQITLVEDKFPQVENEIPQVENLIPHNLWKTEFDIICGKLNSTEFMEN